MFLHALINASIGREKYVSPSSTKSGQGRENTNSTLLLVVLKFPNSAPTAGLCSSFLCVPQSTQSLLKPKIGDEFMEYLVLPGWFLSVRRMIHRKCNPTQASGSQVA